MITTTKIDPHTVVARIDERLAAMGGKAAGKTRWWLSMQITEGKRGNVITDIERRGFVPKDDRMRAIARLLETTTDHLKGLSDNPAMIASEVSFQDAPMPWNGPKRPDLPLVSTAFCDDLIIDDETGHMLSIERLQIEVDHVVRLIERPAILWNAEHAYAVTFHGSSMERRYYQGEIGYVDPRRPPSPGQIGLFQISDDQHQGVVTALAKQLVKVTSSYVELMQYNPEITFRIPRSQVVAMHRIVRPDELAGLM